MFFTAALLTASLLVSPSPDRINHVKADLLKGGLSKQETVALFEDPRLKVIPIRKPELTWAELEEKLLGKEGLANAKEFLKNNSSVLEKAEKQFGVQKEAIVALVGIESLWGENLGKDPAILTLYSLLARAPEKRWRRWAHEFVELTLYCKNLGVDCFTILGSRSGALSIVQFMPISIRLYGYDGDGDGKIDLSNNADAIFSAANFLVKHGWHKNKHRAFARYVGSDGGYPKITKLLMKALAQEQKQAQVAASAHR
ncbi:hypothetical protein C4553_01405 [Candidatus Parcubacteria bacterium]|nr:MAG: hypothetical protein C4553_01405 [Candidatus Parcubacteria bacterium]